MLRMPYFFKHVVNVFRIFSFKIFKYKWIACQKMTTKIDPSIYINYSVHLEKFL